jgi:hypothetical protein
MKTILFVLASLFTYTANAQTNNSKVFTDDAGYIDISTPITIASKKKMPNAEILSNTIVSGKLKLKINKTSTLSFYGSDGRLLYSQKMQPGVRTVDVGNYPKGAYFVNTEDATAKINVE